MADSTIPEPERNPNGPHVVTFEDGTSGGKNDAAVAWDEGFAAGRAAFDAVVAERDEWEVAAHLLGAGQLADLRAERDAAIEALDAIAHRPMPDGMASAATDCENVRLFARNAVAAVSGSSEPRKETE